MEIDEPVASGSADNGDALRQKVAIAERALLKSSNDKALARRANKSVLQKLCQDRNLDDRGHKIELASRLIDWVSGIPSAIRGLQVNGCTAQRPSTPERRRATGPYIQKRSRERCPTGSVG